MSRTKFRNVLFCLSQVYTYFPKSEKIQTCPENSSINLSSLGELLFLAAMLVLLHIFNQNTSWDGISIEAEDPSLSFLIYKMEIQNHYNIVT